MKVSVGKSEIIPVREVNNLDVFANILRCRVDSLFIMKYLGMPLGTLFKTASIWNPILEMEKKLSVWKRLYLSKGEAHVIEEYSLKSPNILFISVHYS